MYMKTSPKMQPPITSKSSPFSQDSLESQSLGHLIGKHKGQITKRIMLVASRIVLALLVGVVTASYFFRAPIISQMTTISSYTPRSLATVVGWHDRLLPYTGTFTPTYEALTFIQIQSTRLDPEGFTVALFAPNIVVDARGVVSTLSTADWEGLKELALGAVSDELPVTSNYRNLWSIQQPYSDLAIAWLRVAGTDGLKEVSVYGFNGQTWTLEEPVGGYTELPEALREAFGATREARSGYVRGSEDQGVIASIKAILPAE